MATDLTVILENRPGTLAQAAEALGSAGINIDGSCGFPCEGVGIFHILVQDGSAAGATLKGAGFDVRAEREVLVLDLEDKPGTLGEVCRRIANAGANIDLQYLATNTRVVIGADDLVKARGAI